MEKPILLLYGNCQAEAIWKLLRRVSAVTDLFEPRCLEINVIKDGGQPTMSGDDWRKVAVVFEQYDGNIPLEYGPAPHGISRVTFPAADRAALWPLNCEDTRSCPRPPELPYGPYPYGDRAVIEMTAGPKRAYSYSDYIEYSGKLIDLDNVDGMDQARYSRREQHTDVKISPFVFSQDRKDALFWTFNHAKGAVLAEIVRQLVAMAEMPGNIDKTALFDAVEPNLPEWEPAGHTQIPLHPIVVEYFGFPFPKDKKYNVDGKSLTHEEWITGYLNYDFGA